MMKSRVASPVWLGVTLAAILAACSSGTGGTGAPSAVPASSAPASATASASAAASATASPAPATGLDLLPEAVRSNYEGYEHFATLVPSAYDNWTPSAKPWQLCHAESYSGNIWRQALINQIKEDNAQYAAAGYTESEVIVTDANGDVNLQLSQINGLARRGCDVIFTVPASPTGICPAIQDAYGQGILVVTLGSTVNCPEAMNVETNEYKRAYDSAKWLGDKLGGGSVVLVNAIPGLATTAARKAGAEDGIAATSAKVVGEIDGQWTPSVAKSEMQKFLSTYPGDVDGVWDAGLMGAAAGDAVVQSGRPQPKVAAFDADCSYLAYWHDTLKTSTAAFYDGGMMGHQGFLSAMRMVFGAKPVANTLLYPLPVIDDGTLDQWYQPTMTVTSNCFTDPVPDALRTQDDALAGLFTGGSPLPIELKY